MFPSELPEDTTHALVSPGGAFSWIDAESHRRGGEKTFSEDANIFGLWLRRVVRAASLVPAPVQRAFRRGHHRVAKTV